ncbi:MAG: hypothetical protein H7211_13715 [Aquabacterium sp.]|nr:hypothetical protein [Ferruginibacter sp.]
MKKIIACLGSTLFLIATLQSQSLIIKGRLKCMNQNANSTKGAENIIVVPTFMPSKAVVTASSPSGYFEFNTGVPIARLQDKEVTVYVVSRCTNCKEIAKRIYISEDQDRENRNDNKRYVTVKEWMLNTNCQRAELRPLAADSVLRLVIKQPAQNLENVSAATALVGAPAVLNFLTTLTTVVGVTGAPEGLFKIKSLNPGKINYGQFLLASPLIHSANTGFNFAPSRDISEAVFWNPSAIANSRKPYNISLLTNLKNNVKLGGFYRLTEKLTLGAGGIYTTQDQFRIAVFLQGNQPTQNPDTMRLNLKEYAAFISPVYKLNNNLSVGITLKSIWQNFNIPNLLFVKSFNGLQIGSYTDSSIKKQHFDVDLSATYKITNFLQAGLSLMNLAGTQLYADAFVPGQKNIPFQKLRSLGLGFTYKWQRLNVGTDLLFTENGFYDASFGINYVPFNNAMLSAGFAVKQLSYSIAFRIKHFRIAYINDNDWMVNEKRKGKSNILNGRLYGGFIFDLN